MKVMALEQPGGALVERDWPMPEPGAGEVLLEVLACGVCRTDLHILDGELAGGRYPIVPGHEIVGRIAGLGTGVSGLETGQRIGVPWLGATCGHCAYCARGAENLCDHAEFTGYHRPGGYAEFCLADARYCFPIPEAYDDVAAAPLLCAGLIGYRSLKLAGEAERIGLYGFGAAAHLVAQLAIGQGRKVYAFTRLGDAESQSFARRLGAAWAGGSDESPPERLDAALIFAPVGALVPAALRAVDKGGRVVLGGIHMSDIPSFPYEILWEERSIRSVANLTRTDGLEFLPLAAQFDVRAHTTTYPLAKANEALADLRAGRFDGAAVLVPQNRHAGG
jgi:propanol-preferring alcohol dehydrogenase